MDEQDDTLVREEYVPCLKAWIDGASDYERNVVCNVMKVLQKGKRDGLEGLASRADMVPAPFSAYRAPTRYGVKTRPETPLEHYMSSSAKTDSRQLFGGYDDKFRKAQKAQLANSKDYICEQSCFNNAMPTFRAHFDIHPDWVSEGKAHRTALTKTSQNGLRYGAKNC